MLCVTALGDSVKMARDRVYEAIDGIHFDGRQYRSDIGWRAQALPAENRPMSALPVTDVRDYLTGLQSRIVGALEDAEGAAFRSDSWTRAEAAAGCRA